MNSHFTAFHPYMYMKPENEVAYIYKTDGTIEQVTGFDKKLSGEDILPGFELDLSILK